MIAGDRAESANGATEAQTNAYVQEIRALRFRVAELERALAEARASQPVDFAAPTGPAVSAVSAASNGSEATQVDAVVASDPGLDFAEAWAQDDSSFAERIAAREFFADDAEDQPSRRWLLDKS